MAVVEVTDETHHDPIREEDSENSQLHIHPAGSSQSVDPHPESVEPSRDTLIENSSPGPIRIPGTYPPEWLPDSEADSCMACDSLFTFIKRRHHCRSCGKIFCVDCCRLKTKLPYLDNKEARVCNDCYNLIEYTLANSNYNGIGANDGTSIANNQPSSRDQPQTAPKLLSVLKSQGIGQEARTTSNESCNTTSSTSSLDPQTNKQVIFSDGIRPGADLTEQGLGPSCSLATDSSAPSSSSLLTRQTKNQDGSSSSKKGKSKANEGDTHKNITVCDELGYLPPIVISKDSPIAKGDGKETSTANQITSMIVNQFKTTLSLNTIQTSMESRSCPLNDVIKFEGISGLVGVHNVVTFLLLKDFYLKVKLIRKDCCVDRENIQPPKEESSENLQRELEQSRNQLLDQPQYWCFASKGLKRFGQKEIVLVVDKDSDDSCIPRDVFKIYLTLHELALRRQALENLGNLLFQDGLFGSRDIAGLMFVLPLESHCLKNMITPGSNRNFLIALILQRWEVPWAKVFPMRLLLRLGYRYNIYPYPVLSFRSREPVYYEVGHTIISIMGDFRNFKYAITHVDGLKVMINKNARTVFIRLSQSNYQQFNKVLDSSNNEHVLAWSSSPIQEADGHLVSVQTDEGHYETVEFYKASKDKDVHFKDLESGPTLGASFIIFSGALKVNQTGQPAKISIVEDGLLIQIQSCTMTALKNAIHFMHHFDIDCESNEDALNRVEIDWTPSDD